jgi:hypothetical protein
MTNTRIRSLPVSLYGWFTALNRRQQITFIGAILAVALTVIPGLVEDMSDGRSENLYVFQANAFLQGRTDIDETLIDVARYEDKLYVVPSPFPAVLLLPIVAIFGTTATYTTLVAALLSILNIFVFARLLNRLGVSEGKRIWLVLAAFLGTGYWSVVLDSFGQWQFAHVVAFTALLLSVNEALGHKRGWLTGLFLGMAVLSRPPTALAGFFLVAALWQKEEDEELAKKLANLVAFGVPVILFVAAYMYFNFIRFGSPTDSGYSYVEAADILRLRVGQYGLFSWRYVPFNFAYMFLQGFHIQFDDYANPFFGMRMDPFGTSFLAASPFIFSAFAAKANEKWPRLLTWGAWLTVSVTLAYLLLYHNNGWVQTNAQRYTLDFLPVFLLLVALGAQKVEGQWWEYAIMYAIALNILALLLLPNYWPIKETIRAMACNWFGAAPFPCTPPPYGAQPFFFR